MEQTNAFEHFVSEEYAARFAEWITTRGAPLTCLPGTPAFKPAPYAVHDRVITDPNLVGVQTYKEVKRFHVALRFKPNRMAWVVTDGSQRKIDRALAKYEDAIQMFDYGTQEAVILAPKKTVSLAGWMEQNHV